MERMGILLDGVTATGAGTALSLSLPMRDHSMQVSFTNSGGSVTALVVDLEGSLDGANWVSLGTLTFAAGDLTAKTAMLVVSATPVLSVRANITTITETGTTEVDVLYCGMQ